MTTEIAKRDEMKAVERWENEGGRVSALNNLWVSLKRFTREDTSRELLDSRNVDEILYHPEAAGHFDL